MSTGAGSASATAGAFRARLLSRRGLGGGFWVFRDWEGVAEGFDARLEVIQELEGGRVVVHPANGAAMVDAGAHQPARRIFVLERIGAATVARGQVVPDVVAPEEADDDGVGSQRPGAQVE